MRVTASARSRNGISRLKEGVTQLDNVTTVGHAHAAGAHTHAHAHEESFVWKYIFSQDHKIIGIQYTISALLFLLF